MNRKRSAAAEIAAADQQQRQQKMKMQTNKSRIGDGGERQTAVGHELGILYVFLMVLTNFSISKNGNMRKAGARLFGSVCKNNS